MGKKLVIDIGNTRVKAGCFEGKALHSNWIQDGIDTRQLVKAFRDGGPYDAILVSAVQPLPADFLEELGRLGAVAVFNEKTPTPLINLYETPESLGKDRLASVVGACRLYPGEDVLVINAGTCVTYDIVNKRGEYLGGSISPGLHMRFTALHTFTGQLPLLSVENDFSLPGRSTRDSMLSGVILGITEEIKGMIQLYRQVYSELRVVMSGGDSLFLENRLNCGIFVVPNIVLTGLNEILDYHAQT